MSEATGDLWFCDGLRFTCTRCGNCCTGAPGYVWVDCEEIATLAGFIGLSIDEFERRFVRRVGSRLSLKERANGDCVFYRPDAGCSVYEHRPRQCRSWPFWESNLRSRAAWRETCRNCPGAGAGRLYTLDEILTEAARICV